jgi:ESCRT-I complex subunit VPS37
LFLHHTHTHTHTHTHEKKIKDDTTYDTVFQTTKGDTLILRVNIPLGSSFVAFCPVMTLAGVRVRHPWINDTSSSAMRIIGYDPIQSESEWKDSNLLLGAAVHDVVKHFQLNPPLILEITDKGLQSIQSNNKKTTNGSNGSSSRTPTRTPPRSGNSIMSTHDDAPPSYNIVADESSTPAPEVPMPRVPLKYPETDNLSREELDELLSDDLEFKAFVHRLKIFDEIFSVGSSRLDENVIVAKENLEQETKWKELKSEVKDLLETLKSKLDNYTKLEDKQNAICAPPDTNSTLRKLHKAKKEAFDESEKIAEEWVDDGGGNVDDFCKQFLERRIIHHKRAAKMEILQNNKQHQ